MNNPFVEHRLANGLRVVIETMADVRSAAAGFFARTGGRDEVAEMAGVSHFLEHMCFKGTPKRTWREVTIDFDRMGSSYNAFTTKDRTFYYGWVPAGSIEIQIELLADMMRSTFPAGEFDMEKKVILEEIAMSADQLDHIAYDFLHQCVYPGHALGWPVLGYDATVGPMPRERLDEYHRGRYSPDNLVLVVAGRVDPKAIVSIAQRLCGDWAGTAVSTNRRPPKFQPGASRKVVDRFNQQILIHALPAPGAEDPLDETAESVASILGGSNSRFYWNIVQQGICPQAGAWRIDYSDCGLMTLSGQCDPQDCERLAEAMHDNAVQMMRAGVSEEEVQRVKNRRRTSLALEGEAPYFRLNQLLDDIDYHGHPRTVEQRLADVDAVTPAAVSAYLEQYPITRGGHFVSVGPRDWLPDRHVA